jgi:hypothetical protein
MEVKWTMKPKPKIIWQDDVEDDIFTSKCPTCFFFKDHMCKMYRICNDITTLFYSMNHECRNNGYKFWKDININEFIKEDEMLIGE